MAGLVAGLAASLAINGFQAALSAISPSEKQDEPATEQAADRIAESTVGVPVPDHRKPLAGEAVHYALGVALGIAYGAAAERAPMVTTGGGSAFALATVALLDEAAVPAAGLSKAPWKTPASTHAYTLSSHLVFGVTAEITRRVVRRALG